MAFSIDPILNEDLIVGYSTQGAEYKKFLKVKNEMGNYNLYKLHGYMFDGPTRIPLYVQSEKRGYNESGMKLFEYSSANRGSILPTNKTVASTPQGQELAKIVNEYLDGVESFPMTPASTRIIVNEFSKSKTPLTPEEKERLIEEAKACGIMRNK